MIFFNEACASKSTCLNPVSLLVFSCLTIHSNRFDLSIVQKYFWTKKIHYRILTSLHANLNTMSRWLTHECDSNWTAHTVCVEVKTKKNNNKLVSYTHMTKELKIHATFSSWMLLYGECCLCAPANPFYCDWTCYSWIIVSITGFYCAK